MHLVQLQHPEQGRHVAIVDEPRLVLLESVPSIYDLARSAIDEGDSLVEIAESRRTSQRLEYDPIYRGESPWKLLAAFDHPEDPLHCIVSGTGLTHRASAENREAMHEAQSSGQLTDSMQMYLWGVEGGRPAAGEVGQQPEWFYKGTGHALRAHGEPLLQPGFADDGGEEPEVAAAYLVDREGRPWRIGFAAGNEFADHVMEKKNYLNLAHSKLRQCSIGPELCLSEHFESVTGTVSILRAGKEVWFHAIQTGEQHMAHSLANLEHHHFKYTEHRRAGQAHVHFLGAAAFSFGAQMKLEDGDLMQVAWNGLGRPLINPLAIDGQSPTLVAVNTFSR